MDRRSFLVGGAATLAACAGLESQSDLVALTVEPRGEGWPPDAALEADFGDVRHLVWAAGGAPVDFVAPATGAGLALTLTAGGTCRPLAHLPVGRSVVDLGEGAHLVFWRA